VIYYNSLWIKSFGGIEIVYTAKSNKIRELDSAVGKVNTTFINVTVPRTIDSFVNATEAFDAVLASDYSKSAKLLDQWLPIFIQVMLMLLAIVGAFAIYKNNRIFLAIVAVLVVILFFVVLVSAVSGTIISLLISDYCVGGIDNHTMTIISSFIEDQCEQDMVEYYLFGVYHNISCDPFPQFLEILNFSIFNVTEQLRNDTNNSYLNDTLYRLIIANNAATNLSHPEGTVEFYYNTTALICGEVAYGLTMLSTIWEWLTGMLFIYLMVFFYTWNRIKLVFPDKYNLIDDDEDVQLKKKYNEKSARKVHNPHDNDCTCGCFSFAFFMFILWGAMLLGFILVMSIGSTDHTVPRLVHK